MSQSPKADKHKWVRIRRKSRLVRYLVIQSVSLTIGLLIISMILTKLLISIEGQNETFYFTVISFSVFNITETILSIYLSIEHNYNDFNTRWITSFLIATLKKKGILEDGWKDSLDKMTFNRTKDY